MVYFWNTLNIYIDQTISDYKNKSEWNNNNLEAISLSSSSLNKRSSSSRRRFSSSAFLSALTESIENQK
jgi:hypothetical protein